MSLNSLLVPRMYFRAFGCWSAVFIVFCILAVNGSRIDYEINKTAILHGIRMLPLSKRTEAVYQLQYRLLTPSREDIVMAVGEPDLIMWAKRKGGTSEVLYWHIRSDAEGHNFHGIERFSGSGIAMCGQWSYAEYYKTWKDVVAEESGSVLELDRYRH